MPTTVTKTARTLQSSASNAAAATTTSSALDLTTAPAALAVARITNGSTGPTLGCEFILDISTDAANWRELSRQLAGTTANTTYDFVVEIPPAAMHLRSRFTGNTAQPVTVEAQLHELTSIG
jgi:hypothetical protein